VTEPSQQPYYARRNPKGWYTFRGEKLESVTHVLNRAPGSHLMAWYGKQAAIESASFLVRCAEVETTDEEILDKLGDCLKDGRIIPDERITKEQAYADILDWRRRMIAAEAYRDFKARIGSLGHHWIYERALNLVEPDLADQLVLQPNPAPRSLR